MNAPDGILCSFCWSSSLSTYSCASPRKFGAFLVFLKRGQSWKTLLITPVRSIGLFVWLRITQDAQGCWDIKNLCSFKKEKGWFGFWWCLECFVSLMPCSWHFVTAFCSLAFPWHMNMLKKKISCEKSVGFIKFSKFRAVILFAPLHGRLALPDSDCLCEHLINLTVDYICSFTQAVITHISLTL